MVTAADPKQARDNVRAFPALVPRQTQLTLQEIAERREVWPRMLKMLTEWERVTGPQGDPVLRHLLGK